MESPIYVVRMDENGLPVCTHEDIILGDHIARERELGVWAHHNREGALQEMARNISVLLEYHARAFVDGPLFLSPLRLSDFSHLGGNRESVVSRNFNGTLLRFQDSLVEPSWMLSAFHTKTDPSRPRYVEGTPAFSSTQATLLVALAARFTPKGTDQSVADALWYLGLAIARRTVAKLRSVAEEAPPPGFFGHLHAATVDRVRTKDDLAALVHAVREHNRDRAALFDGPAKPMATWQRTRTKGPHGHEPQS